MDTNRQIVQLLEAGRPFAVGLVLSAEGSTPREAGVKAALEADGRIHGTLGGGAVEAEAQRRAIEACASGRAVVFEMEFTGAAAGDDEPICGGRMRLLVDPTASKDLAAYQQAAAAAEARTRGVLLAAVHTDGETEVLWRTEADLSASPLPDGFPDVQALRECLAAEQARLFRTGEGQPGCLWEVLVEPIVPGPLLRIAGGGHVGQALAVQAALLGFDVTVLDDRPEFTDPALFPDPASSAGGVRTRCCDVGQELAAQPLGPDTYVVIVTRGHKHDAAALRACVRKPLAYLGMIGSRRKVALLRQSFVESGWATEAEFDRVFAPIGLDIGAETVPEIATSIAAQLVAVRRRGAAAVLSGTAGMPR
jgi:xanthine dehydrogenase accessory factor